MDGSNPCTRSEMKRRVHYVGWLVAAIGTAALLGITFDLVIVKTMGGRVGFGLVELLYLCAIVPPYMLVWRRHGEAFCGFLELERAIDTALGDAEGESSPRFMQIQALIERIDAARGMERQLVRNEAKAWLLAHAGALTRAELAHVVDRLGYLQRT